MQLSIMTKCALNGESPLTAHSWKGLVSEVIFVRLRDFLPRLEHRNHCGCVLRVDNVTSACYIALHV